MGVRNEYGRLRSVLLCKPEYFALQPINVIAESFIQQAALPDREAALREHEGFARALMDEGAELVWVEPHPELPYQVFTRDIGVTTPHGVLLGAFRERIRQGEENHAEVALRGALPIWRRIGGSPGVVFEGGDYMYIDDEHVALGVGARTTPEAAEQLCALGSELGVEIIPVPFDEQYLHLDMIFCTLGERVCTICKDALPDDFVRRVEGWGFEMIEVPVEGVFRLECNLLALDEGRVLSPARNRAVNASLRALGFTVVEVELEELLKGGGGPHCMSFPLERE
jgi:N-dimethylarginine dimethylaminohydrolase